MEKLSLTTDLINGVLQYLGSKPFVEVAGLINEIQKQAGEQGAIPVQQEILDTNPPTTTQ
jgi:hypothetical protein